MNKLVDNALNKNVLQLHDDLVMLYNDSIQDTPEDREMDYHDVKKDYQLLLPVLNAWVGNANLINLSKIDFNRRNLNKAIKKVEKFRLTC